MGQSIVFSQIIKFIPRTYFESWVNKYKGNKQVRSLNCWTWFGSLLFGQLTGHDSIRAIERVFAHGNKEMKGLGFNPVKRSTLSDANKVRSLEVLEEVFKFSLGLAQKCAPQKKGFRFKGNVFALDSSTIELCLNLCPWALFHHGKGAVKLHTAIDIAGDLPQFAVISTGRDHDMKVARTFDYFKKGDNVVMDRAYVDYGWLSELNEQGIFFVTRTKTNCRFKVVESRPVNRTQGLMCDQTIRLASQAGSKYNGYLRRVSYRDPDTDKWLVFLTNRMDLSPKTICDLYKARWKVELFFKTMKQHLKIKKFLGTSAHAVKAQILVALIAYLLVQVLRFQLKSSISIPDAMAVIGTLLLLKQPLSVILGALPVTTRHPPPFQMVLPM